MAHADIPSPEVSGNPVSEKTFIYVITAGTDAIKIGVARDPQDRLRKLQTGHHQRLGLYHSVECSEWDSWEIESKTHGLLKNKRLNGEWFSVSPEAAVTAIGQAILTRLEMKAPKLWCMKRKNHRVVFRVFRNGWKWVKDAAA